MLWADRYYCSHGRIALLQARRRRHVSAIPASAHRFPCGPTGRPLGSSDGLEQAEEYGLTPREASLTGQLVQETSLTEAACELVIFAGTARQYLMAIFEKLGVHSQAELLRAVQR